MNYRILVFGVLLLAPAFAMCAEEELTAYPIRSLKTDSAKFKQVYERYLASESRKASTPKSKLTVVRKIVGTRYLVALHSDSGKRGGKDNAAKFIAIDFEAGEEFSEGEVLNKAIDPTGEEITYASVSSAKETAPLYRVLTGEPYSLKSLYYFLQSGGSILVDVPFKARCQTCRGFGRISDYSKNAAPDRKKPCPDCEKGNVDGFKVIQLKW